jgi:hypothetical protein
MTLFRNVNGLDVPLSASEEEQVRAAWAAAAANPPKPPMPSPREWLERLTPATQQSISVAAIANPSIFLCLLKASGSTLIDVTMPETIAGVGALVTAGVLTAADQATLLAP